MEMDWVAIKKEKSQMIVHSIPSLRNKGRVFSNKLVNYEGALAEP